MKAQSSGALETRCGPGDVEVWRYGAVNARCRRADVERYGALEARCRRADVERYGALEARCRRRDVEARRSGGVGVAIWRYRGLEVWGRDVSVATWRMEARRYGCRGRR